MKEVNPAYFEGLDENKKRRLNALDAYNAVLGSYINSMLGSLGYNQTMGFGGQDALEDTGGSSQLVENLRGMLAGKWKFKESDWV